MQIELNPRLNEAEERRTLLALMREQAALWVAAEKYMDAADRKFGTGKGYLPQLAEGLERLAALDRMCANPETCSESTAALRSKLKAYRRRVRAVSRTARVLHAIASVAKLLRIDDSGSDDEPMHIDYAQAVLLGVVVSMIVSALQLGQLVTLR